LGGERTTSWKATDQEIKKMGRNDSFNFEGAKRDLMRISARWVIQRGAIQKG